MADNETGSDRKLEKAEVRGTSGRDASDNTSIYEDERNEISVEIRDEIHLGPRNTDKEVELLRLQIEKQKLELEAQKLKVQEVQLYAASLGPAAFQGTPHGPSASSFNSMPLGDETESFARKMKAVISAMPTNEGAIPNWFSMVESLFGVMNIPYKARGPLLFPYLNEKGKAAIARLTAEQLGDYETIKAKVLDEHRLGPAEYRRRFAYAQREKGETWRQLAARLHDLFSYYLKSRKVKNLDEAIKLLVADQFKTILSREARQYCVLQEGNGWLDAEAIAKLAEQFEDAGRHPRAANEAPAPSRERTERSERPGIPGKARRWGVPSGEFSSNPARPPAARADRSAEGCFNCGERGHFRYQCRKPTAERRVQHVQHVQEETMQGSRPPETTPSRSSETTPTLVARVAQLERRERGKGCPGAKSEKGTATRELQTVKLVCAGKILTAIVDSGAQISVFRESCIPESFLSSYGNITLAGPFGEKITAKMVCLPMTIQGRHSITDVSQAEIICAVTERLTEGIEGLLTPEDMDCVMKLGATQLKDTNLNVNNVIINNGQEALDVSVISDKDFCDDTELYAENRNMDIGEKEEVPEHVLAVGIQNIDSDPSSEFKRLQKEDESLRSLWEHAERNKESMTIKEGVLYHTDNVHGRPVLQLIVPKIKRKEILELAHDSPCGGHLGYKKTLQRIRASFYWPKMSAEILQYCQSCTECQKRSRVLVKDRVPISPLTRPEVAFQVIFMDIVGPLDPPSSKGHKYILTLVDLCSRWPEAVCLRSMTAKNTCEALIRIFMSTGIPEQVCCDMGGNFISELTKEFSAKLGVTMRFSTPYHPEGHGVVERFNGTLRNMLAHIVTDHGRNWDKYVPYLLWAMREVPSRTLGVSPFEMMYGRVPQGPLSILKNTWTGHVTLPVNLNTSTQKYLAELRERLNDAQERATACAELEQARYTSAYNLRARPKSFNVGDLVLVKVIQPLNKLKPRWEGPAEITRVEHPHKYQLSMPDGKIKWMHANQLREYHARINVVGFAYDEDEEFGEMSYAPTANVPEPEEQNVKIETHNLNTSQSGQIRDMISKYPQVFSPRPGRTNAISHGITLKEGFQPKRMHAYSVPYALRKEVDRQIEELLEMGLIEPSYSEFGHPVVCVAKKDGTLRLCGDYRNLNAGTTSDSYPMANSTELILQVAEARYISVIDLARGYWQVPLEPSCRPMTTFITHKGAYAWTVMPFGLKNAAATFQRLMDKVLASHAEYAIAYLDDVAIFSKDWESHVTHLESVLRTLATNGLTVRADKCRFGCARIVYLGHVVGSGQHAPDPERIRAVADIIQPKTKKELRSFLGFINYYREYIPNFAELARPLTDLTGRRVPKNIPWGEEANKAFIALKRALCDAPSLHAPASDKNFILHTDASEAAVGACLSQNNGNGGELPIAFASKKLNTVQARWSAIEREAFAIIWGLNKFDTWIFGKKVEVVTDHNPLVYLTQSTPRGAKLTRWALALQRYDLTVRHRKGTAHTNADALSRLSVC